MSQPYQPQQGWQPQAPPAPAPAQSNPWTAPPPQPAYGPPQQYYQQPQAPQGYPPQQEEPQYQYAAGSLDEFFSQPSSGQGPGLKFPQDGVGYMTIVSRALTDSDTEHQTEMNSTKPAYFRDGRPKRVLKVPVNVAPSPEFTEGKAQWFCQGAARDDLQRAMALVGAPQGPPEPGCAIWVQRTGTRPAGRGFKSNIWDIRYWRPAEAQAIAQQYGIEYPNLAVQAPASPTAPPPIQQALAPNPAPQQQYAPPPQPSNEGPGSPGMQSYLPPPVQAPAPPQAPPPAAEQVPPPAPPAPPAPGNGNALSPEQQQLLANLTGAR